MRTLLHVFPTFSPGGAQVRFTQIANRWGRAFRHLIVAMDGATTAVELLAPGLDVELLDVPVQPGHSWANLKTFRNTLRRVRPDLLVTSNWGSIEWAISNIDGHSRHLHLEDGFGLDEAERQLLRRVWARCLVLRRSTVVVPSRTLLAIARDEWRLPQSRLFYVPNGIDCDRFAPSDAVEPDTAQPEAGLRLRAGPVVGTVARLRPEKNLQRLIDAFADVSRRRAATLVIVGDGPERAALAARAAALGLEDRVVFAGSCARPERLMHEFSVFALSSDTEQMPLSVLEAMAAALPIAATNVGDLRHMVCEENLPFVVERDARSLSSAICALLDDPVRAAAIGGANARRSRALFDQQVMFERYRKLFDGQIPDTAD